MVLPTVHAAEVRGALIWVGAVVVGIGAEWLLIPVAPTAALVLTVAAPIVVLVVARRLPAAMFALSGVVVGVFGFWLKVVLEWEARCSAPRLSGQVTCSRFSGPIPDVTVTTALVAIGLLIAIAAAWMTRARS